MKTLTDLVETTNKVSWLGRPTAKKRLAVARRIISHLGPDKPLHSLSQEDSDRVVDLLSYTADRTRKTSQGSLRMYLGIWKRMLTVASEYGFPTSGIKVRKPRDTWTKIRTLTREEESRIIQCLDSLAVSVPIRARTGKAASIPDRMEMFYRAGWWVKFQLNTGMRPSESFGLTEDDLVVDGEQRFVLVRKTKNGSDRLVPLNDVAWQAWQAAAPHGLWNFGGDTPEARYSVFSSKFWKRMHTAANLPPEVTMHTLRHTFATRAIEKGVDVTVLKDLMGHSTLEVTMRYVHNDRKRLCSAVALLN